MKKIKLFVKTFIAKLKKRFNDSWYKYVTKPQLIRKEKRNKELDLKALHHNFEERFGVSSAAIKDQMVKLDTGYKKLGQTDNDYLKEKLVEGRRAMNSACNVSPSLVDIDGIIKHNEYYANRHDEGKQINEISRESSEEAKATIAKQEAKIRFNNLPDATKEKLKRILRPV